jgi:DNA-binding NarL/FixJ family response regulator
LDQLLGAVARGESTVAVLSGEAGIGKTMLLAEVLRQSRARGFRVASGRAVEVERDLPFGLLADALDDELGALGEERHELLDEQEQALLAPVFRPLAGIDHAPPAEVGPDDRHRLLGTVGALLGRLAEERPLVLALDDVHWADAASVDLLCHLLHRGIGGPSLLLLAARSGQAESRLLSAFEEAERHGQARRIELAPLSVGEAEQLIGAEIEPAQRETIYRESGGNPFYLEQLAAAARRGAAAGSEERAAEAGVPAGVSAAIGAEIARLTAPARELLAGAALLGEPFEPDLAAAIAAIEQATMPGVIDELLGADLIRATQAPQRFGFRHPIVRHAVYESAGAGWRLAAHARAAAALEARGAPASARAPHIERSARFGEEAAAAVLAQAGQESAQRAPASAAHFFAAALGLIPEREDNLELRLGLLLQRAAALGTAGQIEASREALGQFLALAPPEAGPLRHQATVFAAILDELLGSQEGGRRLLVEELGRLADPAGPEAADLKRELAFTCFLDPDWEAMADWARQSLEAECEGMTRVGALASLALAEFGLGNLDPSRRSVAEAAELFDSLSDAEIAASHPGMGIWLGWAEVCTERFDDAIRHPERAIAISRTIGQRHLTVGLLAVQGQALTLEGRAEELNAAAEAATEAALLTASDLFLSWAMALRCQAAILAGDLHAAVQFGERGMGAAAAASSPQASIARVLLASALLEIGEAERCRELFVAADGELELPPFPLHEALCYELLARAEIALGRLERAEELAGRAALTAQRMGLQLPLAQARRAQALVLMERGEPRAAAAEAEASSEAAAAVGAAVDAARSRTLAGAALAAAGEREAAIAVLEAAHRQLLACGALHYGDEAARQLRKLGHTVPSRRSEQGALGLSRRESEVMELVSAGKTNRQIAAALFLSVRTVDRHLSRIFEKLEVSSRAAASSAFERARSAPSAPDGP